ncbi:MAG: hypothetical protein WCK55_20045 [Verrucomicrobiota bacterium]|jgi:predicted nucleic acid-binding protein
MLVVSDTSPLTALLKIGRADLLRQLFAEVLIPPAVHSELLRSHPLLPGWQSTFASLRKMRWRRRLRTGPPSVTNTT